MAEIGIGTWGMGGWSGSDDEASKAALRRCLESGCNFLDTARAYGNGRSEALIGAVLAGWTGAAPFVATKIPPKNGQWPARAEYPLDAVFPADHIRSSTEQSLAALGVASLDLQQFHVWTDAWADDERWQRAVADLKSEGLVKAIGISVNRWEPANVLRALRTGLIDAVQVVYNIFDQAPEDELFPLCQELGVAIIARVPFDEGSLTGTMTVERHVAGGRLAEPLFHPREPPGNARPRGSRQGRPPGGDEPPGTGAALHPAPPGGDDRHPGDADAPPRGPEPGGLGRQALPRQPVAGHEAAQVGQGYGDSVGAGG